MKKTNLVIIYKKVKQRVKRSSGQQIELAKLATEAAKAITLNPTLNLVLNFRKYENEWLQFANTNSKSLADEFEQAIKSNNYISKPVYNSNKNGYKPKFGYIYCFASDNYPGIVKIGSTTYEIHLRLSTYKSRHGLDHLEIVYSIYTSNPSFKEQQLHKKLLAKQIAPESIPKSTEWFRISKLTAKKLIKSFE